MQIDPNFHPHLRWFLAPDVWLLKFEPCLNFIKNHSDSCKKKNTTTQQPINDPRRNSQQLDGLHFVRVVVTSISACTSNLP